MPVVKIKDITVPDERFGGDQRNSELEALKESILRYGILEPPLLNEDGTLVAGYRRVTAAIMAGMEEIEVKYLGNLSALDQRRIELEENIMRLDLDWRDRNEAIAEIHKMKVAEDPKWNADKTADLLGVSRQSIYNAVHVVQAIEDDPTLRQAKTLVGALKERDRKKSLERRAKTVELKKKGLRKANKAEIKVGDAYELIQQLGDGSVDAIVTNCPFGVDLTFKDQMEEVYHDDEDYITDLIIKMVPEWYRVLRDDSWLVAFFDVRKIGYSSYQYKLARAALKAGFETPLAYKSLGLAGWLQDAGFSYVTVMPLMWAKPNKTQGLIGNPDKGFISAYEAFVFAAKGDAKLLKQGRNNVFVYDTPPASERVHPLQMPFDLCTELVSMVAIGGETVLDTFAGSGSIGIGALNCQCDFIGFELDAEKARNGNTLLGEHDMADTDHDAGRRDEESEAVGSFTVRAGKIYDASGEQVGVVE